MELEVVSELALKGVITSGQRRMLLELRVLQEGQSGSQQMLIGPGIEQGGAQAGVGELITMGAREALDESM